MDMQTRKSSDTTRVSTAKRGVVGLDQLRLLLGAVARTVLFQNKATDAVRAEVVRDDVSLPVVGQMPTADDFQAAVFRAAGIQALQDTAGVGRRDRKSVV